jgi:dTDP-D-glucose 4,6-dehydratase
MIIVTGGAGFIGSAIIAALNKRSINDIIIVDQLGSDERWKNLANLSFADYIDKDDFLQLAMEKRISGPIKAVFHLAPAQTQPKRMRITSSKIITNTQSSSPSGQSSQKSASFTPQAPQPMATAHRVSQTMRKKSKIYGL